MTDLVLEGCVPETLASYLKALAVQRIVAEQLDPTARSWWDDDGRFHLESAAAWEDLVGFFVHAYVPTPAVTPWNGDGGWWGQGEDRVQAIRASSDPRFGLYRQTIQIVDAMLAELGIRDKPKDADKQRLLERCRSRLPDGAIPWLDAVYAVSEEPTYAALLGSGGNDGRMDFASNFMQRLAELFLTPAKSGRKSVSNAGRLDAALFARRRAGVARSVAVGQFAPSYVGGANMGNGFSGSAGVNPWDYVLAIEGALLFAGATVRRLESARDMGAAFPFHVKVSAVGYASSSSQGDASGRSELWLPLWQQPASCAELIALFGEGRLQVGKRRAQNGLDAARAMASLGIDRGIDRFQRVAILVRNGLAHLATAQGTITVRAIPRVALLEEPSAFARAIERAKEPPPAVSAALRLLQSSMFDACRRDRPLTDVLCALGALARSVTRSPKVMTQPMIRAPRSLGAEWYTAADDGSTEFALAASFASWRLRPELEPYNGRSWDLAIKVRWAHGQPIENLVSVARRRFVKDGDNAFQTLAGRGHPNGVSALKVLLGGASDGYGTRLDARKLDDLLFGLAMVTPPDETIDVGDDALDATPCVLRAVTAPSRVEQRASKDVVTMLAALEAGQTERVTSIATRRLRASGWRPVAPVRIVTKLHTPVQRAAYAAALLLPLPRDFETRCLQRYIRTLNEPDNPGLPPERND